MPNKSTFSTLADKFLNNTFKDFARDISIIEEIETSDGQGGTTTERMTFTNVKGFVFPQDGSEIVKSGGLYTDKMVKFSMEPISGLTNKMIIKYTDSDNNENDYFIESVSNVVDANVWINVMAKKDENL